MSEKRNLFDVIEDGKRIENDLNLTSMERISEGVGRLVEMTEDAFEHIKSLEDAIEKSDAMASRARKDLASHIHEEHVRYGALAEMIWKMSDNLLNIQKCTILLLDGVGRNDMASVLREQIQKQKEEEEKYPF